MLSFSGLENNYQIRISKKQLEIDKNNNTRGVVGRYPYISFDASANRVADRYVDSALTALAEDSLDVNSTV